jgi:hypothetical protein
MWSKIKFFWIGSTAALGDRRWLYSLLWLVQVSVVVFGTKMVTWGRHSLELSKIK